MEIATYILFVLGVLGATDIALFHSIAHGIRSHRDSRTELIVHSLRGPTYGALFILIPNFAMQGLFFWLLMALFTFDLGISIWDFAIERESRRFFGGLPSGEYILHILIAMLFGSLVTSVALGVKGWGFMPARFAYEPADVPYLFRVLMFFMSILVMISGILDAAAAIRLGGKPQRHKDHKESL